MKKMLLGLGILPLVALPTIAVVSCSSAAPAKTDLNEKEFNVKQSTQGSKTTIATEENVLDPAFNNNAKKIVDDLFEKLTKEGLQHDFDLILTDFYDIFEFENASLEIELVDKGIKVIDITRSEKGIIANLDVSYKMENENTETEGVQNKKIEWEVRPMISSNAQIVQIKEMIKGATSTNPGIDITDLKEYFLGENEDDADLDDIGVFDRIAKLNNQKDLNNLGGLLGYELKLSDIFSQIAPKQAITLDTVFFAPSASLDNTFIFPSSTGSLNYELDEAVLKTLTIEDVTSYTTPDQLNSILKNKSQNTENIKLVSGITVDAPLGQLLKVTVNFNDGKLPEVISININLLKAPTTPPVVPFL